MNNLQRMVERRMNLLKTSAERYFMAQGFYNEQDYMRMAEALDGVDCDALTRVVDKGHAKRIQSEPHSFMDIVYEARQRMGVK